MDLRIFIAIILLTTVSCSTVSYKNSITPVKAIQLAANSAPNGVKKVVTFKVKETGIQNRIIYLNSQKDYRDQRNISIDISPQLADEFKKLYNADPGKYFKGKNIAVKGEVKRMKVWFICDGKKTEKYYYQTHIKLTSTDQIKVL